MPLTGEYELSPASWVRDQTEKIFETGTTDSVDIKGHQHLSGASHTDPGINWNWSRYYGLTGYFFQEPDKEVLKSWDLADDQDLQIWKDFFEEIAD